MEKKFKTEQEEFWRGEFGDEYVERNKSSQLLASNIAFFSTIIGKTRGVKSVIEFGANIGMNLKALNKIITDLECSAVEINHKAVEILKNDTEFPNGVEVYENSILDFNSIKKYDLSLIKGVLIHINPSELEVVYQKLYDSSNKYICIAEYYNPSPVTISYRGRDDRLFKRDFAGEFLDKFKDVQLIDYGFVYHRDTNFPQDDITWFLLEKK